MPRMVALTLLDGTQLKLPARPSRPPPSAPPETLVGFGEDPPRELGEDALTLRDLLAALRAVGEGSQGPEILGANARWEPVVAALLSLLVKKHLITEWEFTEELKAFTKGSNTPR